MSIGFSDSISLRLFQGTPRPIRIPECLLQITAVMIVAAHTSPSAQAQVSDYEFQAKGVDSIEAVAGWKFHAPPVEENSFYDSDLDPSAFTWSDDERDPFAAKTYDELYKEPVFQNTGTQTETITEGDNLTKKRRIIKGKRSPLKPVYEGFYPAPRITRPIPGTRYTDSFGHNTALYGWPANRQPLRIYFSGNLPEARDGLVPRVFLSCLKEWCIATAGRLKYSIVNDFKKADVIVCREFTSDHELAENLPSFHCCWLDRVKIRLIDSACDEIPVTQLRAVLLHSVGHALGYFEHSKDALSAMNENCAHVLRPIQRISGRDASYLRAMYESYSCGRQDYFHVSKSTSLTPIESARSLKIKPHIIAAIPRKL